jgi:hypothetical protein
MTARPVDDRWSDRAMIVTEAAKHGLGVRWAVTAAEIGGHTHYTSSPNTQDGYTTLYRQAAAIAVEMESRQATLSSVQAHMLKATFTHTYPDLAVPAEHRATVMAIALQATIAHDRDDDLVEQAAHAFLGNRATAMPSPHVVMAAWNAVRGSTADQIDTRRYMRQDR